jgi:4-hydroxybenzoate polyprenyltransferase
MKSFVSTVRTWGEMIKFSHSVFALPFALMAAFLAGRNLEGRTWPLWGQLGLVIVCMVAARSVAMTFNRIVDTQIDARNPRTHARPLPAGRISMAAAYLMLGLATVTFGVGCLGFYIFYQNTWPILLSGPVLIYLCAYSLTKRFTRWSHFALGLALALSPIAAWLAIHPPSLGLEAVLLLVSVACWVAGFDIIYACQDIEVDRREGLHSLPARVGPAAALWIARACHGVTVLGWIALGLVAGLGWIYAVGVTLAALLLVIENTLVRPGDYSKVNAAFFTVNGIVSVLLACATVLDLTLATG